QTPDEGRDFVNAERFFQHFLTKIRQERQSMKEIRSAFLTDPHIGIDVLKIGRHILAPTRIQTHQKQDQHDGARNTGNSQQEAPFVNKQIFTSQEKHYRSRKRAGRNRGFMPILALYSGRVKRAASSRRMRCHKITAFKTEKIKAVKNALWTS